MSFNTFEASILFTFKSGLISISALFCPLSNILIFKLEFKGFDLNGSTLAILLSSLFEFTNGFDSEFDSGPLPKIFAFIDFSPTLFSAGFSFLFAISLFRILSFSLELKLKLEEDGLAANEKPGLSFCLFSPILSTASNA